MASKSLNLLLNSALIAMAVGVVAFNTGLLNPYLPEKPATAEATTEDAGTEAPAAAKVDSEGAEGSDAEVAVTDAGKDGTEKQTEIAAVSDQSGQEGSENKAEESASGTVDADTAEDASPAGNETGEITDQAGSDVVPPRFDIVRVEPDGNVVIAGNAASGATVEVITGARTLGSTTATGEGDFAVVLSDPLDPGDYTIVLRATSSDNIVAMSTETAIVSVPETASGEVLAIVDEPGKPSKLITVPEAEVEQSEDKESTEIEVASAENPADSGETTGDQKVQEEPAVAGTGDATDNSGEDTSTGMTNAGDESKAGDDTAMVSEQEQKPAEEAAEAAAPSKEESQPSDQSAVAAEVDEKPVGQALEVAVEAVEIEGNHVFVAGTANPGMVVRVYANKDLIGETQSSEVGRFLVESTRGLAEGEYIIRADMLELGSAEVIARAAVPFEREAGESIAAVAPQMEEKQDDAAMGDVVDKPEAGAATEAAETGESTVAMADQKPDDTEPGVSASAASESSTVGEAASDNAIDVADEGGNSATGTESSEQADIAASDDSGGASKVATAEVEEPMAESATGQQDDTASGSDAGSGSGNGVNAGSDIEQAAAEEEKTEEASAGQDTTGQAASGEQQAVTAPKLEKTSGSVIIRRGDTLWRISRRVYGRGIRYTTIYTANRGQIENPHRIWPGQIFDVPGVSDDGEVADLEAIADQTPTGSESE
ncbi:MAG: LysM peptidoglycan-binding domain-containing protein [Rhizobiaceae bacterium]